MDVLRGLLRPVSTGRRSRLLAVILGVGVLATVVVGGLTRLELRTDTDSLLPAGDPTTAQLAAKDDDFGGDAAIVILQSKDARSFFTDQDQLLRLLDLEGTLAGLPDVAAVYGPGTVLNQTAGAAQDMLAQIMGRRDGLRQESIAAAKQDGLSDADAAAAGRRAVRAFDERYGSLLVQGLPAGLPTLRNPQFVQTVLFDDHQQPRPQWRFIVPADDKVALLVRPRGGLDQTAAERLTDGIKRALADSEIQTVRTTVTGVPVVTAALSERAAGEAPELGALSVLAVGLVITLVPWTRRRRSRLRPAFAAAIGTTTTLAAFGWLDRPLSLGVVAFLPILLGIGSDFPIYLSRGVHSRSALVAAAAGVIGFASLALSPLPFVEELGIALGAGITATVLAALALRTVLGPVPPPPDRPRRDRPARAGVPRTLVVGVAGIGVLAAVAGWLLLPGLPVQSQPEDLAAGLPELAEAQYAEDVLGSTGEVSVVVKADDVAAPDVLRWSRASEARVVRELGDRVHPVLSLADLFRFLGAKPTAGQVDAAMEVMPRYLTSAVVRSDRRVGVMLYGVEFDDVADLAILVDRLQDAVSDPPDGATVEVVGLPVTAVRGLDLVSQGRLLINLVGIALATVVVGVGLRSVRAALRALAVVLLATGWVAVLASATTGALNPLTVAIGSLVTATGCEFAVMLRSGEGGSRVPVVTAALAGTAGYLVLAASQLPVLRDFGLLLASGVLCSLAAALLVNAVLTPARARPAAEPARADAGSDAAGSPDEEAMEEVLA
ncbi:MAG TPA: RND transporter [Nocardioides sp.]|nr:RND transporter [Nocardioides sp.]